MQSATDNGHSVEGLANSYIKPNALLSAFDRLEIYNRQYWFRVIGAVVEDYPGRNALFGDAKFDSLALAYLRKNPSTSFTLRNLGSRLPQWLHAHPKLTSRRHDLLVDVARLEWAYIESFDSASVDPLSEAEIRGLTVDSRLSLQPHLQLLDLRYPVDELILAVHQDSSPAEIMSNAASEYKFRSKKHLPSMRRATVQLAIHRFENTVYYRRLDREPFVLISEILNGETLGRALEIAFSGSNLSAAKQAEKIQQRRIGWPTIVQNIGIAIPVIRHRHPLWKNPYSEQYNLGMEQQFGNRTVLSLNYVGSASHCMDVGGYYNTGTPAVAASFAARHAAGTTGQPYPYTVPQKFWDHNAASAYYNALQASLVRQFGSGFGYTLSYTWSKTLDEGGDGYFGVEGGVPEDPYNPKGSRGPASFNIPQIFTANAIYELPFGTGKPFSTGNRLVNYIIGNWQLNGIFSARSGQNINIMAGGDIANTGNAGTYERANLVGNPYQSGPIAANPSCTPPAGPTRTRSQWFNPCAFEAPDIGTLGNASRNFLHDQNFWNLDTSVHRLFPIKEDFALKIDVEAFNVFNHPVLGSPATTVTTSSSFGQITSTAFGNANRILQFAAKIQF